MQLPEATTKLTKPPLEPPEVVSEYVAPKVADVDVIVKAL